MKIKKKSRSTFSKNNQSNNKSELFIQPSNKIFFTNIVFDRITISASVGKNGVNRSKDVRKIQERLHLIGLLSVTDFILESASLSELNPNDKVSDSDISKTIEAIKSYEATVEYVGYTDERKKPTGKITIEGITLKLMNTHSENLKASEIHKIREARKSLNINTYSSIKLEKLVDKVGRIDQGNSINDLTIIQEILEKFNFLKSEKREQEKPNKLITKYPKIYKNTNFIKKEHIPETIKAIIEFQNKKVKHWKNKRIKSKYKEQSKPFYKASSNKEYYLSNTNIIEGVIEKDDATFNVLSSYQTHEFKFKDLEKEYEYKFENTVKSNDAINIKGVYTSGKIKSATIELDTIKKFGLSDIQAKSLKFVSTHEGNFDSINTYDKAFVSYGFIQFAGGGRSLNILLALIKKDYPEKFDEKFRTYGIDVDFLEKRGRIIKATTVVTDAFSGKKLRGVLAENYIRNNIELIASFVKAGHDGKVQESQIKLAAINYVLPASKLKFNSSLNIKFIKVEGKLKDDKNLFFWEKNINTYKKGNEYKKLINDEKGKKRLKEGELNLGGVLIKDVLTSVKSTTVIINMAINDGLSGARKKISKALKDYIIENNFTSIEELKNNSSDVEILKKIKKYAFKPERIQSIIDEKSL